MIGGGEQMDLSIGLCCSLISFSTREYSILLTAIFISFPNSPSSSKKEGPLFHPFFLPLLVLTASPPSTESYDPLSMSGSPPREPADDAHGPGTATDAASNTGQCPIQYPGLLPCPSSSSLSSSPLPLSLPSIEHSSWCHRDSRKAW